MKFGIFAFIFVLFNCTTFFIIEDEGGAGADESNNGDDGSQSGDNNDEPDNGDDGSQSGGVGDVDIGGDDDTGESALSAEEIRETREILRQNVESQRISEAESDIKTRIPAFSSDAVISGLRELHKTDPKRAAYYNASPAGWEMYYKEHLSNVAESDDVNDGSHSGSGSDFGGVMEKARGGNKKSVRKAIASSKA